MTERVHIRPEPRSPRYCGVNGGSSISYKHYELSVSGESPAIAGHIASLPICDGCIRKAESMHASVLSLVRERARG